MSYMVKLNRRFILPLILNIVGLANLIFIRYTVTAIQTWFPTLGGSPQILDFILSMVSIILTLPGLCTLYKLSHEPPKANNKN